MTPALAALGYVRGAAPSRSVEQTGAMSNVLRLAIVDPNDSNRTQLKNMLLEQIREIAPECALLVVSNSTDGQVILRAMRGGAKEFLTQPIKVEDLIGALDRISAARFGTGEGRGRTCHVIACCGATGGV